MATTSIDRLLLMIDMKVDKALAASDKLNKKLQQIDKTAEMAQKKSQNLAKSIQNVLLSMGMAFLFTGMALERFFMNALKGLLSQYRLIEGEGGIVNNAINELIASVIFLGYSLFDAFKESGMLQEWIDYIQKWIDKFNALDESTKSSIMNFIVWGTILSAIMMVVGMFLLFIIGPISLIAAISASAVIPFLMIFVIIGFIIALVAVWKSDLGPVTKILLGMVIMAGLLALAFFVPVALTALMIILFIALIAIIVIWRIELTLAIAKAAKAVNDYLGSALNWVIDKLNYIIALYNRIAAKSKGLLPTIESLPYLVSSGNFESVIAGLEAMKSEKSGEKEKVSGMVSGTTNNFTFNGDISDKQSFMDEMTKKINESINFAQGSPQSGGS